MPIRPALLPLLAISAAPAPIDRPFVGAGGLVRLRHPATLRPGTDFSGRPLMTSGWRLSWDGAAVGPGTGVVRFTEEARPMNGEGHVTESVQVGMSRDPQVVAHCGTTGMPEANGRRLPNRMLGGHRWTAWTNGDAGMSQHITATDLRTVVDGICYAIDRITYAMTAAPSPASAAPAQGAAAVRMDAILAGVRVGRTR